MTSSLDQQVTENTTASRRSPGAHVRLRSVLRANAVFSAVSGVVLLLGVAALDTAFGVAAPVLAVIGASLIGYGAVLWLGSAGDRRLRPLGWLAVIGDEGWVIGALLLLVATDWMTAVGRGTLAAVTVVVAAFSVTQLIALRRRAE